MLDLIIALDQALYVKRVGLTFVISVSFEGETAAGSAKVANAVASSYLDDQVNAKLAVAEQVNQALTKRADELRKVVAEAERKVQNFQGADHIMLQQLNTAAETARAAYETFQRRSMETEQAADNSASLARLVSPASPPIRRSWPRSTITLLIALVLSLFLGLSISLYRQRFGKYFKNGDEVEFALGRYVGQLRLSSARHLRRQSQRGDLTSGDVLSALEDPNSSFADVGRRVAVEFDRLLGDRQQTAIGVLTFGSDVSGSVLAFWLSLASVKANRSTVLVEAQQRFRFLADAWRLEGEQGALLPQKGESADAPALSNASGVAGISLPIRDATDVTPQRVRELVRAIQNNRDAVVVSFSDHDLGSTAAWISGLDAVVIVLQRKRTSRRYIRQLRELCALEEKLAGVLIC